MWPTDVVLDFKKIGVLAKWPNVGYFASTPDGLLPQNPNLLACEAPEFLCKVRFQQAPLLVLYITSDTFHRQKSCPLRYMGM